MYSGYSVLAYLKSGLWYCICLNFQCDCVALLCYGYSNCCLSTLCPWLSLRVAPLNIFQMELKKHKVHEICLVHPCLLFPRLSASKPYQWTALYWLGRIYYSNIILLCMCMHTCVCVYVCVCVCAHVCVCVCALYRVMQLHILNMMV